MIKNKKKFVFIIVICICLIASIIVAIDIKISKSKNKNIALDRNNTNNSSKEPQIIMEKDKKVGPVSGWTETIKGKDTDKNYNLDENKIPHGKVDIELDVKNTKLRNPKDNEVTQDTVIRLMRKFVVPDIYKNTGNTSLQIKIDKIDKVYIHECYLIDVSSVRNDKVVLSGKYAVSTNGKFIYKQDPKTKEYDKYIPEK